MHLLLTWLVLSLSVWLTSVLVPGFRVKDFGSAIWVAALFGVLNSLIGWLIFGGLVVVSLGIGLLLAFITRWIVNAILLKIVDAISDGLHIRDFRTALVGSAVMSLIGTVGEWALRLR